MGSQRISAKAVRQERSVDSYLSYSWRNSPSNTLNAGSSGGCTRTQSPWFLRLSPLEPPKMKVRCPLRRAAWGPVLIHWAGKIRSYLLDCFLIQKQGLIKRCTKIICLKGAQKLLEGPKVLNLTYIRMYFHKRSDCGHMAKSIFSGTMIQINVGALCLYFCIWVCKEVGALLGSYLGVGGEGGVLKERSRVSGSQLSVIPADWVSGPWASIPGGTVMNGLQVSS